MVVYGYFYTWDSCGEAMYIYFDDYLWINNQPDCVNCKIELWFFHQNIEHEITDNEKPIDGKKTARNTTG